MVPKLKPVLRNGKPLTTLERGDKRRLADGRNAWRKMTPQQRREFLDWMEEEDLAVAPRKRGRRTG